MTNIQPAWAACAIIWWVGGTIVARLVRDKAHLRERNFLGHEIEVGAGVLFVIVSTPIFAGAALAIPAWWRQAAAFAIIVGVMGLLGFLDDCRGDRASRGLRGHVKSFLKGKVTTGFLKAAGGLVVSLFVAKLILQRSWLGAVVDGTIIALSANALNLLDLRPGRAGAVFILSALLLLAFDIGVNAEAWALALLAVLAVMIYFDDRAAKLMMGDVGSNSLGGALGLAFVLAVHAPVGRLCALAALIGLHVLAERVSISALIERNPILRRLDRLTGVR